MALANRLARLEAAAVGGARCPHCRRVLPPGPSSAEVQAEAARLAKLPADELERVYRELLSSVPAGRACPHCGKAIPSRYDDLPPVAELRQLPSDEPVRRHRRALGLPSEGPAP